MSNYQTPKELGEIEAKEAVLKALKRSNRGFTQAYAFQIVKWCSTYCTFTEKYDISELCKLLEKVIEDYKWKIDDGFFDVSELAMLITNELIACEFITQETLEELGQKQLNEAF